LLPFAGSNAVPSPFAPPKVLPRPFLAPNPFFNAFPYAPIWPTYYDVDPLFGYDSVPLSAPLGVTAPMPKPAPISDPLPPPQPADLRARLTLNIPAHAQVFLAGKEVDAAATPVVLESPDLREGQRYNFDVKVTWKERDKTQERARVVTVDAGDNKSLTYAAAGPR
jgi:uncharacterized protein (TIGR03000 family)